MSALAFRTSAPRVPLPSKWDITCSFGCFASLTVHRRQLQDRAQRRDLARLAEVLVPHDGLGHGLGGPLALQQREGPEPAVELEGQARGAQVRGRGADVVQQARQRERGSGELQVRELGAEDGERWVPEIELPRERMYRSWARAAKGRNGGSGEVPK